MNRLFQFRPLPQERVWGGRGLETKLSRDLPEGKSIGESWEVVDREEAQSVVEGGPFSGKTLRELLDQSGDEILGSQYRAGSRFPILVKWLDCKERLSLQVHPPASIAEELNGEPKTENWYIADCEPGARILVGLKAGATREEFEEGLENQTLESLVHPIPVRPGDSILVESGRIHAIDAGNFILEIQQNSDTTYRVYDWGRVGLDGNPRELHVEQSLQSIDFQDFEPDILRTSDSLNTLADCPEFRIRKFELRESEGLLLGSGEEPCLVHVVQGSIDFPDTDDGLIHLSAGTNALVPVGFIANGRSQGESTVLVTDRFLPRESS